MSPSEADLRAALRHGEGDGVDADRVLIAASRRRERRRTRLLSVAGAVVVVGGLAAGLTALTHGDNESSAGSRANAPDTRATAGPAFGAASSAASCPAVFPHFMHPGASTPAADSPLFSQPVNRVLVCGYGPSGVAPAHVLLTGSESSSLVSSLEQLPTSPHPLPTCPAVGSTVTHKLAMIGIAANGSPAGTVTAEFGAIVCGTSVTNGTAVRYGWQAPSNLQDVLTGLYPGAPSGTKHASPIRS